MGFLEKLVETTHSIETKAYKSPFGSYEDMGFRMFQGVKMDEDIHLSIQASYSHYCSPRKTLKDLTNYSSMELAIIKSGEFVNASEVTQNKQLVKALEEYYEGTVYGNVPVALLEGLYQYLNKNTKLLEEK